MVSRIATMSSSEVRGLTIANLVSVSPACDVGTTKANWSASSRSAHSCYCAADQPIRRKTTTERSGSRATSR